MADRKDDWRPNQPATPAIAMHYARFSNQLVARQIQLAAKPQAVNRKLTILNNE